MKFNKWLFEEYKDMFNYHSEIQNINSGFRLFFNKKTKQIMIININKNYEICNIFSGIFEINVSKLRFLRIENLNQIIKNLEISNFNLETKNKQKQHKFIDNTSKEFIKLTNRSPNITIKDINKIIGVTKC